MAAQRCTMVFIGRVGVEHGLVKHPCSIPATSLQLRLCSTVQMSDRKVGGRFSPLSRKFLRAKALSRWHKTFADMQAAVSEVLDHLQDYRAELRALMTEKFHIIAKEDIPVEYREAA